jgi:hypothetical protein
MALEARVGTPAFRRDAATKLPKVSLPSTIASKAPPPLARSGKERIPK